MASVVPEEFAAAAKTGTNADQDKTVLEAKTSPSNVAATRTGRSRAQEDTASLGGLQRCLAHHVRIVLEVVAAITSGTILAVWSGEEHATRTGTHFRCDSAALALVSTTAFGMVAAFSADASLQLIEGKSCRVSWWWWGTLLRVFLQANAYGLTFLVLLDNATIVLVQMILVFSASSLVMTVTIVLAHVWRMGSDEASQLKVIPLIRTLSSERRLIWIFFASWLFFLALAIALLFAKPAEKLGLSQQVVMTEHFCLMFVGALIISWALCFVGLLVMPLGRRMLFQPFVTVAGNHGESPRLRRRPTPSLCETLPRAAVIATVTHLMGGMVIAVAGCSIVVATIIFLAKSSLYTVRIQEKEEGGKAHAMDTATTSSRDYAGTDGQSKAAWQDGHDTKSVSSKKNDAAALRLKRKKEEAERKTCKGRAKRFILLLFMLIVGFIKVGAVFTVFLFDVTFVTKHMKKDGGDCASRRAVTGTSATPDFSNLRLLSEVPSTMGWSPSLGPLDDEEDSPIRRMETTISYGPVSPSELGSGIEKVLQDMKFDGLSTASRKAVEVMMDIMEWIVSWEIAVPDSVQFRCTGIRRLVSASAVLSCVCLILVAGMMDLLSIMGASKEIARARAGSDGSFARYVITIAKVQILEFLAIQVLQLAVSSGSRLKFEALGYFDQNCGYLVDPNNLAGSQCPNIWHMPVEAMSSFLIFWGLAVGMYVFIAILSGSFYGLPAAAWIMQAFFGQDLVLSNFGGGQKLPPLSKNWLGSRLEQHVIFRMLLRPIMGLSVTLGIWTTWASRTFQCGMRQDWYEPVEGDEADEGDEGSEAAGGIGSSDLVSWKSMYQATAKGIAVVWVPIPLIGSLLSKATLYLNEFVLLAFGYDGGGPSGRPQKIITHMQEDRPSGVQALHWCSQVSLVLILVVIEFDLLKNVDQQQRLTILGTCIILVIVMATIRMALDITLQFKTFKSGRGLLDSIEDIVKGKTLALICEQPGGEPQAPLQGLPAADRGKVLLACRELLELPWCQNRTLPRAQRTYLLSSRISASPSTQVAVYGLRALANEKEHVSESLVRAALILALHQASSNEIESSRAKLQAHRHACRVAEKFGKDRALALQQFLEEEAKREVLREARRRATLFQETRAAKPGRPSTPLSQRRLTLTLTGRSRAVVSTTAVWKKSTKDLLDKPREVSIEVSATVEVKVEWGPRAVPGSILPTSVTISRSVHQIGQPTSAMGVPKDPQENLPTLRRGFTTKSTRSSSTGKGGSIDADKDSEDNDDDQNDEEDVEGQVFGLDWLQESMEKKKWKCCSRAQAIVYEPVSKEPKWEVKDLGTHWYPQGSGAGDGSADVNGRAHAESLTRATVGILRSVTPAYDEGKVSSSDEEDMVRCLEDLEEAIRSSLYNPMMLLNSARFLSGLEKGPMSESAARQARLLAVAWKLIKGQERRTKMKIAELEKQRRREEEEAAKPLSDEEASVIEEPTNAEHARAARADARQEALEKLKELLLLETTSADELSIALDEARRADVDPMVLSRAEEVFVRLVSKQQAALALAAAIQAGMIGGLRSAIKQGRTVGLRTRDFPDSSGVGVLEKAKQLLSEAEAGLREELRSAIDVGAIVGLERALAQAKEGGLDETDPDLVKQAQEVLRAAELRKQRINLLKNALQTNDAELLKATIREVEEHDLQKEVDLTKAKLRLQALERAAGQFSLAANGDLNRMGEDVAEEGAQQLLVRTRAATALRAAMFQEPVEVDMLKLAIQQAKNAGLTNGPDIQRALAMVEVEDSKAVAVKRVREAAGRRDVRALQDAISRGNSVGVAPAKLLSAVNQLLDEQAKVAQLAGDHGLGNVVLADVERERRELHDRVQMSNGGLRVVVRIRPLILQEGPSWNGRGTSPAPPLPNHPSNASTASPSYQGLGLGLAGASVMAGRAHVGLDANSPMSPHDEERRGRQQELPVVFRVDRNTVAVSKVSARSNAAMGKDDTFRFGAVFGPDSIQAELFSEVQGLVQSAVDGYNVLVLACGPVGGGKTFTMMGENHDARGVVPRVGEELFHIREKDSWRAELEVDLQMLEVLDSTHIVDLLGHWDHRRMPAGVLPPTVRLVSQDDADNAVFGRAATSAAGSMSVVVDNVVTRRVGSKHELKELTQEALSNAGRGGESPARHVIQLLNLSRRNLATGAETRSKIALVDLSGMGQHAFPEVNAAYRSLEDVLRALAARQQRVPFREHVLPQVLQDCMGGSSKTLLMLALPPEGTSRQDSLKAITLASCGTW